MHVMAENHPALIVVDMQRGMANPFAGRRNNPEAEGNIVLLLSEWRARRFPVVHVRHLSRTPASPFWPGQVDAEFQPQFMPAAGEHVVEKNVPDAFINTGLEPWLVVHGIERLVIVGVSTNISVESTARTGANLGFGVTVVADATFAFEKADYAGVTRTADEVHAMSLGNLDGEFAKLATTSEVLDSR
jgi:nicotinamidase-related amidase